MITILTGAVAAVGRRRRLAYILQAVGVALVILLGLLPVDVLPQNSAR